MQIEPDEIRNFQQDCYFNQRTKNTTELNPFTVFLSVLAAILFAWFLRDAYIEYQAKQLLLEINKEMQIINEQQRLAMEQIRLESIADNEAREERAYQRKYALHQQMLANQAVKTAEIEARNKKADAWLAFYKPSKECTIESKNLINCANEHARAKNKFETEWSHRN